jgi:hypothetical protein
LLWNLTVYRQDEGVGKEEGLVFFRTPDQVEEFDRIKDVIDRVMMRRDPAEALAADAYEANLARGGSGLGPRGGGASKKADGATASALSSSAARRAAVLPISRNRKKKDDASGGAERGSGSGSGGGDKKSTGLHHPGKLHHGAKGPNQSDVSWKEGRSFPKRSSSIGTRYQVSHIPEAGTFDPTQPPESKQLYVLP